MYACLKSQSIAEKNNRESIEKYLGKFTRVIQKSFLNDPRSTFLYKAKAANASELLYIRILEQVK